MYVTDNFSFDMIPRVWGIRTTIVEVSEDEVRELLWKTPFTSIMSGENAAKIGEVLKTKINPSTQKYNFGEGDYIIYYKDCEKSRNRRWWLIKIKYMED